MSERKGYGCLAWKEPIIAVRRRYSDCQAQLPPQLPPDHTSNIFLHHHHHPIRRHQQHRPQNAVPPNLPGLPGTIRAPPPSLPRNRTSCPVAPQPQSQPQNPRDTILRRTNTDTNHNKIPLPPTLQILQTCRHPARPNIHDAHTIHPRRIAHPQNLQPNLGHLSPVSHQQGRRGRSADYLAGQAGCWR